MDGLKLKVKPGSVFRQFNQAQVDELLCNFFVCLPPNARLVQYSQEEPCNVDLPWQPIDGCGDPIGKVQRYDSEEGVWKE